MISTEILERYATMIGAAVILADPICQGLAISLLFGLASSTLLTVLVIPAIYVACATTAVLQQGRRLHSCASVKKEMLASLPSVRVFEGSFRAQPTDDSVPSLGRRKNRSESSSETLHDVFCSDGSTHRERKNLPPQ